MTKKCPFCAEEIQSEAVVCKHCKKDLPPVSPKPIADSAIDLIEGMGWKRILKFFAIIILVSLSFSFWFLTIPAVTIWYLWKKTKYNTKAKIIASCILIVVFGIWKMGLAYSDRTPTLTITEPQNNYSVQAKSIEVKGKVVPAKSTVAINKQSVSVGKDGTFSYELPLPAAQRTATVTATNGGNTVTQIITVNRIFTDEEKADMAKQAAEQQAQAEAAQQAQAKAQAVADAKAKADQAAYDKSKAGQLCKKHPDWSKDDCQDVADNKLWIGMHYEMVKAERGLPNHVNTSNYGNGNEYQACWDNYNPYCFYFKADGIITSYN